MPQRHDQCKKVDCRAPGKECPPSDHRVIGGNDAVRQASQCRSCHAWSMAESRACARCQRAHAMGGIAFEASLACYVCLICNGELMNVNEAEER